MELFADIRDPIVQLLRTRVHPSAVLLIGAPFSGKSSQSAALASLLDMDAVSSGEVFRDEVRRGTERGQRLRSVMEAGQLVPTELFRDILEDHLVKHTRMDRLLLDGFVREEENIAFLDDFVARHALELDAVIYLHCSYNTLRARFDSSARKECLRADDVTHIFVERYHTFAKNIGPVLNAYRDRGRLVQIDGEQAPETITFAIATELLRMLRVDPNTMIPPQVRVTDSWVRFYLFMQRMMHRRQQYNLRRRVVLVSTDNVHKWEEYRDHLSLYGLEVYRLSGSVFPDTTFRLFLRQNDVLAIFRDEMTLVAQSHGGELRRFIHGQPVVNACETTIWMNHNRHGNKDSSASTSSASVAAGGSSISNSSRSSDNDDCLVVQVKHSAVQGRIDMSRRLVVGCGGGGGGGGGSGTEKMEWPTTSAAAEAGVFGWDDIFTVAQHTNDELRRYGVKISPRNHNIATWIEDVINPMRPEQYRGQLSFATVPMDMKRGVDFDVDPAVLVQSNPFFQQSSFARRVTTKVLNGGVFFRSATNRRVKHYWCPGLNAGIPLTPKDDAFHEATYLFHDFCHFLMPDLVFTGEHDAHRRRVYITWRMMSEAVSMTLADMVFVDEVRRHQQRQQQQQQQQQSTTTMADYPFHKRRIYPLFEEYCAAHPVDTALEQEDRLFEVVLANVTFCLTGHAEAFADLPSYADFKQKYESFFVGDLRWTHQNYENMVKDRECFRTWWRNSAALRKGWNDTLWTVDRVAEEMPEQFTLRQLLGFCWNACGIRECLVGLVAGNGDGDGDGNGDGDRVDEEDAEEEKDEEEEEDVLLPSAIRRERAFRKYHLGQCFAFAKFDFLKEARDAWTSLATVKDCDVFREQYGQFLRTLADKAVLAKDDVDTHFDVFPLFPPFYLNYALFKSVSLADTARALEVYPPETNSRDDPPLNNNPREPLDAPITSMTPRECLARLVEVAGGVVEDGVFVRKPGVCLLADNTSTSAASFHTFFIAGVSVETSMELIAHREAKVARLTTSKTKAMDQPLYRITDDQPRWQKECHRRAMAANRYLDRHFTRETRNMLHPGTKATALCYTMMLTDFHKLFLGRAPVEGNETEVREVIQQMHAALYALYPKVFNSWEWYVDNKTSSSSSTSTASFPLAIQFSVHMNSRLTDVGKDVMVALGISRESDVEEWCRFAAFQSALTYLTQLHTMNLYDYVHKVACIMKHRSVLAGWQSNGKSLRAPCAFNYVCPICEKQFRDAPRVCKLRTIDQQLPEKRCIVCTDFYLL